MQNLLCVPMPSSVLDTIVEKRIVMKHSVQIEIGQMHLPHTNFAAENILSFSVYAPTRIYFHPKNPHLLQTL